MTENAEKKWQKVHEKTKGILDKKSDGKTKTKIKF